MGYLLQRSHWRTSSARDQNEQTGKTSVMIVSDILKTSGYGLLHAASHKDGAYCVASIPCEAGSPGSLGRMYMPKSPKEPPPA